MCDDEWKSRQNMQLVKSFGTTLGGPIADESLRHWPGLRAVDPDEEVAFDENLLEELDPQMKDINNQPDFEKMTKKQMKKYAKDQKEK
ncbi:hypothetical protein KA013_00495 [Patescibacteria group bacterium]|nr:hypothetical protein [Patescibacteria group bacterium]